MNVLNQTMSSSNVPSPAAPAPRKGMDSSRALAALLLAALVAALIVVADQLVDSWSDGNLLAAWVAMWAVAFAALGLLASPARRLAGRLVVRLDGWSQRIAQRRALAHYLEAARQDPRIRADLQYALDAAEWRSEGQPEAAAEIAETRRYIQWFDQYRPMHDWRADSGQSANVGARWWGAYIEPATQWLAAKTAQQQQAAAEPARLYASEAWQRELQWAEPRQASDVKAGKKASAANRWRHSLLEGLLHYRVSGA